MIFGKLFKSSFKQKIANILTSKKTRAEVFSELEETLILADISPERVERILKALEKRGKLTFDREDFLAVLKEELKNIFITAQAQPELFVEGHKKVILIVGINGSGKTTSAAKLGYYYQQQGKKVLLSAADTFRAAGSSQLTLWGERLNLSVVGGERGADPGSVVFNSLNSFQTKDFDVLVIDTAGRVQTRDNLMKELEKIDKIIRRFYPAGPTDALLVIDATMGQNTLDQARKFKDYSGINGLILAKLDGTAKGGTIINILDEMKIPVKFAGIGETQKDFIPFSSADFIDSLFSEN